MEHEPQRNERGRAVGVAVYWNCAPAMGAIEIGGLVFSPRLQRRPAASEAMSPMLRRVFDELGYRRYERKCDSPNLPSRAAFERRLDPGNFAADGSRRPADLRSGAG
jgi:RimJ/RimL family protein N-acetyltransferase